MTAPKTFVLFEMMNAMLLVAQEAKARGHRVVALNHDPLRASGPFTVPPGVVDEVVPVASWADTTAVEEQLDGLARGHEIAGTYAVFEGALVAEASLRARAGLPTTAPSAVRRVLDKGRVRAKLYEEGLTALRSVPLEQALRWERWEFGGPAVLKPANGTGSALCFTVGDLPELHRAAGRTRAADVVNPLMKEYILAHGGFVLEERAEGELLSVESLVHRGQVHSVGLTGRYVLASDPVVEQGLFFPYQHPRAAGITAVAEALHKSLEIEHGATHLEVMVAGDGTVELIDFNARFAGFASAVSFGEVFGVPFGRVLTDVACGIAPDMGFLDGGGTRCAAEMVVLPPPGTTVLEEVSFPPDTVVPRPMKEPGQRLTGRADQLDAVGMFIVVDENAAATHERALRARRRTVVNGRELGDNPNNAVIHPPYVHVDRSTPAAQGAPTATEEPK